MQNTATLAAVGTAAPLLTLIRPKFEILHFTGRSAAGLRDYSSRSQTKNRLTKKICVPVSVAGMLGIISCVQGQSF